MRFKRKVREHAVSTESTPRDFSFSVTRTAIAQICKSVGFKSTQLSSLDILTDIAIRYIISIANSAVSSANSSSRTECNIFDVLRAINNVHFVLGFTGASCFHKDETPLQTSGIVHELIQFVKDSREIPFAKPLPRSAAQSGLQLVEHNHIAPSLPHIDDTRHIPGWLPALPDVSTHAENHHISTEKKRRIQPLWGEINAVGTAAYDQAMCEEKKMSGDPVPQEPDFTTRTTKRVGNGVGVRLRNVVSYGEKRVYCNTVTDEDAITQTKKRKKGCNSLATHVTKARFRSSVLVSSFNGYNTEKHPADLGVRLLPRLTSKSRLNFSDFSICEKKIEHASICNDFSSAMLRKPLSHDMVTRHARDNTGISFSMELKRACRNFLRPLLSSTSAAFLFHCRAFASSSFCELYLSVKLKSGYWDYHFLGELQLTKRLSVAITTSLPWSALSVLS